MRRLVITCAGAAALFLTASFAPPPGQAMTIAAPAGLSKAIQETKLTEDVAYVCRGGWWWRRCAWVPGPYWGARYYRPYYAYAYRPAYYAYRPAYYAYAYPRYRPWWGWRRRWWW
jgi:hypothetical protein